MRKSPFQIENEQIRRTFLVVLYESGKAVRARTVRTVMDRLNSPTAWEDFIAQAEYLAGEELIRIFPVEAERELTDMEQAKYLARCRRMTWDSPEANEIMLRIRQRGRRFLEGNEPSVAGVAEL